MASLNHVEMWLDNSWVHVTAAEAAQLCTHNGTVPAHSGLFMCSMCGQYVTFTAEGSNTRHFRHSSKEDDKNCPERTFGPYYYRQFDPQKHELPLKVVVEPQGFRFELGFLYIPRDILLSSGLERIVISTTSGERFAYNTDRLNDNAITYLPVGSVPSIEYRLVTSKSLATYWAPAIKGIQKDGSLFEYSTGKMLPVDSDVQINRSYYLVTKTRLYNTLPSVRWSLLRTEQVKYTSWYLYEVKATTLDHSAAKFFMSYHYRLTDAPIEIRTLWPIHIEDPYVIKHSGDSMILHIVGRRDLQTKTFPYTSALKKHCSDGTIIQVSCHDRQQLVSFGQANVLHYTYFWREHLNAISEKPTVIVEDGRGYPVPEGQRDTLPKDKQLKIHAPYDGYVVIRSKAKLLERRTLHAGTLCTIDNVQFDMDIQVLQGLDVVWKTSFISNRSNYNRDDDDLMSHLLSFHDSEVILPHRYGAIVSQLSAYPKTRRWFQQKLRQGRIPENALKYLRRQFEVKR